MMIISLTNQSSHDHFTPTPHRPFRKLLFLKFSLFNYSLNFFQGGQLTPFAHMCGRPCVAVQIHSSLNTSSC